MIFKFGLNQIGVSWVTPMWRYCRSFVNCLKTWNEILPEWVVYHLFVSLHSIWTILNISFVSQNLVKIVYLDWLHRIRFAHLNFTARSKFFRLCNFMPPSLTYASIISSRSLGDCYSKGNFWTMYLAIKIVLGLGLEGTGAGGWFWKEHVTWSLWLFCKMLIYMVATVLSFFMSLIFY